MRPPGQGFLSWIVLVVYFVGTAVANRSVVLCQEVDGGTAIEIAGDHGQCHDSTGLLFENDQDDHTVCRQSCRDSCPCEDSSLAVERALVVKKDRSPGKVFEISLDVLPWSAGQPSLHWRPTPPRPNEGAAAVGDVTRRSLRTVVLLL